MSEFEKEKVEHEKEEDAEDNGPVPEEESTATFTPVVKLETVEVKTFEEDEDVLAKYRAKLFEYGETLLDKGTGVKQWKEKGVGDIKLLKHRETGKIRVLMRQEKTMKVICNHFLDPRISITPHGGSDKSLVWVAFDFSDNELVERTFAIRFGTPEVAQEFKSSFVSKQEEMKKFIEGLEAQASTESSEAPKTETDVDDAAKAIENLSVSQGEPTN